MDRVLRNARLSDGRVMDLHLTDGLISAVVPAGSPLPSAAAPVIDDLQGYLVLPAMAEPHAHLDKALTAEIAPNPKGDLMGAIEAHGAAFEAGHFHPEDIVARATAALELLLIHGVTAVRSHVNVGEEIGATWVVAVDEARRRFAGLMDIEIVALMHSPMSGAAGAGNRAALAAALAAGADLVGGCPALDPDGPELIRVAIDAATEAGVGIDLHVDETLDADMLTLRSFARQIQDRGFSHRVAASHCVSLAMQPRATQQAVAAEVAAAGIAVIPLPQTNLFLQGRDHAGYMPRAIAPIDVLRDAGVLVAAGADNVQDPFNPVGRSDGLETAALLVMASHQLPDLAYRMVSNDVRAVMGLPLVNMRPGDPADLMAIDAPSTRAAIADASPNRRIYRRGVPVATTSWSSAIHR